MTGSDAGRPGGLSQVDGDPRAPHAALPDAEIRRIAAAVSRAMGRRRPPDDPRRDVLSPAHELPPADEDRVAAALAAIRARAARRGRR